MDHDHRKSNIWLYVGLGFAAVIGLFYWTMTRASAQEVYVGVHGGQSIGKTELTNTPGTFSLDGLGSTGYVGGLHAGMDLRLPNSAVFAGLFAGYDWTNDEFSITFGSTKMTATVGNSWYVGGRAGVLVGPAKLYALTAFREASWSSSIKNLTLADPKGFDLGIGAEIPIAKNVSLGIEGVRTQYQKAELMFGATPAPTGIHAETDVLSVMARLNFQFGNFPAGSLFDDRAVAPAAKACDPKLAGCK